MRKEGKAASGGASRSPIVLVVDDNEANRSLAKNTLEDEDYEVVLATGGLEAIAAFERTKPDCIVLDVRMPDLDGFAVCEAIRKLPDGSATPVLFLTALRDVDTFDRALRAGGDDFLSKPIRPTELVVRVQSAIKLRRMSDELRGHYDLLRRQRDDLIRLQLQKERLSAFIVHDLKNPVASMDMLAQLLLRDRGLSEAAREAARQIRTEARQLDRMILNLLDVAKGDEGKLAPQTSSVDLRAITDEVFAELTPAAKARQVTLLAGLDVDRVVADESLLRRTLANLVENAIRHAPRDTEIGLTAVHCEDGDEIRVTDAGQGVSPNERERIFDPFVQAEGHERPQGRGRGLGLTFCKLAVEAHGGRIWIEDALPGAIFCVKLPHVR